MNKARATAALMVVFFGLIANLYSDVIDDWLSNTIQTQNSSNEEILVGIQENENWLIIPVSFQGDNFDLDKAQSILESEGPASSYIEQISAEQSILNATILDEVWVSSYNINFWGEDSESGRDSGSDGAGVDNLVENAVKDMLSGRDLSPWDFDNNGIVDRLLILHSANPQEISGGSSSIWSHMSGLDNPIKIGKWSINHYTIASTKSGVGTIVHEMLHQMGAFDLYDVHSSLPTSNWNGIGAWGIMASGNWNGNGNTPALPSSSTLELIGIERGILVDPNYGGNFTLSPISDGGNYLNLIIGPGENIKITNRGNYGFDTSLPGHGILVEHQDTNNGDTGSNLVNTDSKNAWLKIIEADGDDALIRNKDSGSGGDVFTDGDIFGNTDTSNGMIIYDNRGRLVSWSASVEYLGNDDYLISITPIINTDKINIITPRQPVELLNQESLFVEVVNSEVCDFKIQIQTHNGNVINQTVEKLPVGVISVPVMKIDETYPLSGNIIGTMGCDSNFRQIDLRWHNVGHRIISDSFFLMIDHDKGNTYSILPEYDGDSSRFYNIDIQGAASRIATLEQSQNIIPGDEIEVSVNPDGLLLPGMIARGELVLVDNFGIELRIPVTFEAKSTLNSNVIFSWLAEPGNGLFMISILLAISIISGGSSGKKNISDESE
ncbi:MAG: immune inhibitor A domain-containing protein [Candidatus Thalassarchaeaceae archaeon]